jgi:hypothetical protein
MLKIVLLIRSMISGDITISAKSCSAGGHQ